MAIEKKKFFSVEIPAINQKVSLLAYNLEQLNNRNIKVDLTRMLRGQSVEAIFKVKTAEGKAIASPIKIYVLSAFIARMMRKSISYVEDSFSCECDDAQLRIKPFMITRKKVTRAVRKALRNEAKKYIQEHVKEKNKEELFAEIINGRLQKSLSLKMKKIYPLAFCEIRHLSIEKEKEKPVIEKVK